MAGGNEIDVRFYVKGESAPLVVRAIRGREGISELFRFEIDLISDDPSFDLDACVGEPGHLTITWGDVERHIDGLITSFAELGASSEGALYRAELIPQAGLLDLTASCRTFSEIAIPELIQTILAEHGISDVRISLAESYKAREIIVQYNETDWAMLSRWMEAEGIRYFFEHRVDGHTLVITDAEATHDAIDGRKIIAYRDEALDAGEDVLRFELSRRIVPAKVMVRDYPLDDPRGSREESAEAKEGGKGRVFAFPATGAKKRLDALRVDERRVRGTAGSIRMVPGRVFELERHPRDSYNAEWLITSIEHIGNLMEESDKWGYRVAFECVPAATPYRPPRRTPWPRILGAQMATIAGPDGAEIHTDESGRALAVFHWDQGSDGKGTPVWLPLSQLAASQGFGSVHLPRVGDAVLVEFLDGDPGRPVVTGRMYHKVNVHPYTLPGNRTKTVFRDASTPGGNGYNELTFESQAGAEEVYLRAQRDARIEVLNDATRSVGNDDKLLVDGDRSVSISGASARSVGGDESISIMGGQSVSIGGSQSVSIAGSQSAVISGDRTLGVGGDLEEIVEGSREVAVRGGDDLTVEGDRSESVAGGRTATITGDDVVSISGSRAESVEGNAELYVDGQTFQSHGSLYISVSGETAYSYTGDVKHESTGIQKIGAPTIYIAAGKKLYLRALESVTIEVGDAKLTVEDGKVTITDGTSTKTLSGDTIRLNC